MTDEHPDSREPAFDRKPWLAFMGYGVGIVLIVCAFIFYREAQRGSDCSDLVASMWDWNLARTLGVTSRCPYRASYASDRNLMIALFILWPPFIFLLASLLLMRLDQAGVFNIVGRVRALFR